MDEQKGNKVDRRTFLGTAAAAGVVILEPRIVWGTQANSAVRLGVLGCGGRGRNVASSFIENTDAVVTAIADLFPDALEKAKKRVRRGVREARQARDRRERACSRGRRPREQLFASKDVDAVYVATPPYFHPYHLEMAIAAGKHVYLEKPVAVDVPGCKKVLALGERAKGKLSFAVGFQIRHASPYVELAKRIHAGQIGQMVSGQIHYFASALNRPDWPANERRLRNWVHDRVLSGDVIVEQNVHIIDVTNWMFQAHPVKAVGGGGRAGRTDQGDCLSHFNLVYTYPNDVHVSFASTQFGKSAWGVGMQYYGTKGCAEARYDAPVRISGDEKWEYPGLGKPQTQTDAAVAATGRFSGALDDADRNKQNAFVKSIQSGQLLNEAQNGADAALSGILGREAAYKGEELTWEKLLKSKEVYEPKIDLKAFA